ncbi:hypothetical protein [Paenibacillus gorillae]|uniref:hypothetical protein n=1 Tax=Paenibacillus gorillae TaxID=1243662 RepID=UPI0004BBAD88|nr:hypothetical protein [Paenibacillus gorillae]
MLKKVKKHRKSGISIYYITITNNIRIVQKAQSGGQINRNVGYNANQGGQNAVKKGKNVQSGAR